MAPKIHFGLKTTQYFPYADILRVWLEADTLPLIEHAWLFDHPMPIGRSAPSNSCLDGWTTLTALAAQTKRLRLGLLVTSNANQTPQQLAKRAATLDVISNGRLELGLGAGGGVEREHTGYGIEIFSGAERVRRLDEACQIIRRMWTEPSVDFEGRYYHATEAYCEPKPVQKPTPPFVIGGAGEQLTLRVVAKHADVWNYAGFPSVAFDVAEFQHKSQLLDQYCREIGRDPATLARSIQLIIDKANPEAIRQTLLDLIAAGATHLVLGPRVLGDGIAHWINDEIFEPVLEALGGNA